MDLLKRLSHEFKKELEILELFIQNALSHDIALIQDLLKHATLSGGKRFRPLLLIASTALVNGNDFEKAAKVGAAIELIHTATLLHDDVVDENDLRRGRKTANHVWGNAYTILTGDYLFTKAFHLLIAQKNIEILDIASTTAMRIAEGEVLQIMNIGNFNLDLETSIQIIQAKTAQLISAACKIGAIIGGGSQEQKIFLEEYGIYLGILFQIGDDILDYTGDTKHMGKPVGSDFWEGKITLPLLYALKNSPPSEHEILRQLIKEQKHDQFHIVGQFIAQYQGIEKTLEFANDIQAKALGSLSNFSNNKVRNLFEGLTRYCLTRIG